MAGLTCHLSSYLYLKALKPRTTDIRPPETDFLLWLREIWAAEP
jgi:hypothetical protein